MRLGVEGPESVADHSRGLAWLVLALCPPSLERGRALAIAVVHDLAEARTGDITPHDGVPAARKATAEREALADLVAPLPGAAELRALREEYATRSTPEGRFVKACDKLEMALQAARYRSAQGIDTAEFVASALVTLGEDELGWLARG